MPIVFCEKTNVFHLFNDRISYVLRLAAGRYPIHVYWGRRVQAIHDDVLSRLTCYSDETFSLHELPLDVLPQECPTFGVGDLRPGMLHIEHSDGSHALDLQFVSYRIESGKPALSGLPSARGEHAQSLLLTLCDAHSGVSVELAYTIYDDIDIIARSAKVINHGASPVVLRKALSACVDFEQADFSLLTLSGAWARERGEFIRPLGPGHQGVSSERGASGHQTSPFMALLAPNADETAGEVYAFALCYSGSFAADVSVDSFGMARAQIGINPFNFSWTLEAGGAFQTPEAYLCYSPDGLDGMSQQFHALIHRRITTGRFAAARRPILVNNWEATYFNFSEEKLLSLARCAKDAGVELFVLDDGWFGHRESDNSSLGDWFDNTHKLPHGLRHLSDAIHALGLKFGLWVEPEMISPDSELYRAHPDWCIHVADRMRIESRHQFVLDLSRQDVRDYIVSAITDALRRGNVDYVKWDMNRNINMWGSSQLSPSRQTELSHRYMLGLYEIMERVISRFPDVLFESCAGGGGRFDLGMMCFMPQAWCSDDTDAWMRCRIQHATSYVFPPSTMGAHVSAVPNHQTGRITPLTTRAAVAMGGSYGYELDLTQLSPEELEVLRQLNTQVKALQPLLLYGAYHRLRSPFSGNDAAWMSVSDDQREAVVTHVFAQAYPNQKKSLLRLRGLNPFFRYRDEKTGALYGGDELMYHGIPLCTPWNDYMAQQFHLTAID